MSLLIKALANAEKDKQAELHKKQSNAAIALELAPKSSELHTEVGSLGAQKSEEYLSLEQEAGLGAISATNTKKTDLQLEQALPVKTLNPSNHQASVLKPKNDTDQALDDRLLATDLGLNQKAAAKVFVANQAAKPPSSVTALLLLGVGGAVLMLLGLQGYQYLTRPAPVIIQPSDTSVSPTAEVVIPAEGADAAPTNLNPELANSEELGSGEEFSKPKAEEGKSGDTIAFKKADSQDEALAVQPKLITDSVKATDQMQVEADSYTKNKKNTELKLVRKVQVASVDPALQGAYQAFLRGDDSSAQQQYREVLKKDVRNIDALLGMAAIAQRRSRVDDAAGWYRKVLEFEPQNSLAQSALVSAAVAQGDENAVETHIKNLLAQQPEAAHLYAALGHYYAEHEQWASAQSAYFDASRLASNNADYAFNVAVSLEHLGKGQLALSQYQRALELLHQSDVVSPDRTVVEARIQALQ